LPYPRLFWPSSGCIHRDRDLDLSAHLNLPYILTIKLPEPYQYTPKTTFNKWGLPKRGTYRTRDVCQILGISPATFRARIKAGLYKDLFEKEGVRRIFAVKDIEYLIEQTQFLKITGMVNV
jgi:hypothetical protein